MLFRANFSVEPINGSGPVALVDDWVCTSLDEVVMVTNVNSGERISSFAGDGETISTIALSPDKSILVAASRSLQLHIWSMETKSKIHTFPKAHESTIMALTIDPTSSLIATGGAEGAVKVWDFRTKQLTHKFKGHAGPISCLSFYGQLGSSQWHLASGSEDSSVRVWDLVSTKCKVWNNHANTVTSLAWTSRGDALLSGGRDKILSIYRSNEIIATLLANEEVEAVGFAAGHIYAGVPTGIKIWSLDGTMVSEWQIESNESELIAIKRIQDGVIVAVLSDQTLVELQVDAVTGQMSPVRYISLNHGEIIDLMPLEAPETFAIATNSQDVRIISLSSPLEFQSLRGHQDVVIAIDVLGRWLASAGKDKEARLWDTATGDCKLTMSGHTAPIGAVSLSRGSDNIPKFIITGSQDLTVKKWNADGEAEYTRKAHDKDINSIDVSRDNNYFASASQDRTIKIWRTDSGETVGILRGHRRGVWNVKFGTENTVISGSGDKTVRQWSLSSMTCLRTFEGHTSSVLRVLPYFSGSQYIASAGGDGLVKIWEPRTSECIATLDGHEDRVWSLATTSIDGSSARKSDQPSNLLSGGGDGVIRVWQDYTVEEQQRTEKEQEEEIELRQDLDNSIRKAEWGKAISLALRLNHPLRLLKLFNEVGEHMEDDSISGLTAVDQVLAELEGDQLFKLLERVRDWNTSARTSYTAQTILHALIKNQPPKNLWNSKVIELIGSILPYSERHIMRIEELLESSYALDYNLKLME